MRMLSAVGACILGLLAPSAVTAQGGDRDARREVCRSQMKETLGQGAAKEQRQALVRACMQRGKSAGFRGQESGGSDREARREACRAEMRQAMKGSKAPKEQRQVYVKQCMQRTRTQ